MNELVPVMEAQTLEDVLASGDLSKLTPDQRVAYYFRVCESLRLNPYTRPFDYITLNGKRVLYAKRDCTDQLRQIRNITLTVTDKHIEDDLYIVTVRATDGRSRSDEDFGAVSIAGLKGEARANAILKAITKAKRRVTLSICGMGINDESEVLTIPGAITEDLVLPPPDARDTLNAAVPLKAVASATPRAPVKRATVDASDAYQAPPEPPPTGRRTAGQLLDGIEIALRDATSRVEVDRILDVEEVFRLREHFADDTPAILRLNALRDAALERHPPLSHDDDGTEAHEPETEDVA